MKINRVNYYKGPSLYSFKPSIGIELDIGDLEYQSSDTLPGFTESLLACLSNSEKDISRKYQEKFSKRLKGGILMGPILEHLTIIIQQAAGIDVSSSKTIMTNTTGIYEVIFEYKEPHSGIYAFKAALELADRLINHQSAVDLKEYIDHTARLYLTYKLNHSTEAIYNAAEHAFIPVNRMDSEMLRLGTGSKQKYVKGTITSETKYISVENASNRQSTKDLLRLVQLPVPDGLIVHTIEEIFSGADYLGFPLVIKPLERRLGKTITNIKNRQELFNVVNCQDPRIKTYLLERHYTGNDFRLLIIDGKMAAASHRVAPYIIGNGKDTIQQLIEEENKNPLRGEGLYKPMSKIPLDHSMTCFLEKSELSLQSVPSNGQVIQVMGDVHIETGGHAVDVTDQVHPSIEKLGITAAKAVGLDIAGVDIICQDISAPLGEIIISDVHVNPNIRMHHYPAEGKPRDAGRAIIDYLFTNREDAVIPVIAMIGGSSDNLTTKLLKYILEKGDVKVGVMYKDRLFDREPQPDQDLGSILTNPFVDLAVIELNSKTIIDEGLPFCNCDIGIISMYSTIETQKIEDVRMKSLVAEKVIETGTCILNANDVYIEELSQTAKAEVIVISNEENSVIDRAISSGRAAWFIDNDGWIIYTKERTHRRFLPLQALPNAASKQTVEQMLQALAAAHFHGISLEELRGKLLRFNQKESPSQLGNAITKHYKESTVYTSKAKSKSIYKLVENSKELQEIPQAGSSK